MLGTLAHARSAGRFRSAAPRRSRRPWSRTSKPTAGRWKPGPGSGHWRSCPRSGPRCWTWRRPDCCRLAEGRLPDRYRRALESFRFGNGACKVDFILSGPVPWAAAGLADAGTVHVGGTRAEMAEAENLVAAGRHPDRPYVLVSQPSRFDAGRAPGGRHILWSYCHVPAGSTVDMAEAVMAQLERFAPGFRDLVVSSQVTTAAGLAAYNENYVGGDFSAGLMDLRGMHPAARPEPRALADSAARRVPVFLLHAARVPA